MRSNNHAFIIAALVVETCAAQMLMWTQLTPTGTPPAGDGGNGMVFDAATDQLIAFGAGNSDNNSIWTLSLGANPQWTLLNPAGPLPAPRVESTVVYDSVNARMIIFGGGLGATSPCANDVWVLSNANSVGGTPTWGQLSPTGGPPSPRNAHSAVYDQGSNRMIVFGGDNCFATFNNEVWVLTNANGLGGTPTWTLLTTAGTPPAPSESMSAVYDPVNNRMILFGTANAGGHSNQVWVLTNANGLGGTPTWIQLMPAGPLIPARNSVAAIYDPATNRMTIFGGSDTSDFNDTWVLTNANGLGGNPSWTQLSPSGALPPLRDTMDYAYDSGMNRLIIFGGNSPTGPLNDTWALSNANAIGSLEVRYFSNLSVSDSLINITNTGASATAVLANQNPPQNNIDGSVCVNIYAFAADEQEVSCCSCLVTPNGLYSAAVKTALLNSTLTSSFPNEVVVKLISTVPNVGSGGVQTCNPAAISQTSIVGTAPGSLASGLLGWGVSAHGFPTITGPNFQLTETPFLAGTLSDGELARDVEECQFIQILGSGQFGICKGCGNAGLGGAAQ